MSQQPKADKKQKNKSKAQIPEIRDMKPKKDVKGGEISLGYGKIHFDYKP